MLSRGLEVSLVVHQDTGELAASVPPATRLIVLGEKSTLLCLPKLIGYLRREQPQVLLSLIDLNNVSAIMAKLMAFTNTKVVVVQHTTLLNTRIPWQLFRGKRWKIRLSPFLYRIFLRWADAVVAISQAIAEDLARVAACKKAISVIHNPIIMDGFQQRAEQDVCHPWLQGSIPVFVSVGRLAVEKDIPTLLRAFKALLARVDARLIVVGDGPLRDTLVTMADNFAISSCVDFVGYQENPLAFVSRARALVLTSLYEGFPTVLVEALACGTHVISTDCKHGPSEILGEGKFGRLTRVGDWQSIAEAMFEALTYEPPKSILRQQVHGFTVESSGQKYLDLFASICK